MPSLDLNSLELVSTLRVVPKNGSPSSQDYNDSWNEVVTDLATVTDFLNTGLMPMLNLLQANASGGLDGTVINANTVSTDPFFFDTQNLVPLSIADCLSRMNGIVNSINVAVTDVSASVLQLQTRLATTNQNDITKTVQGFANTVSSLMQQVNTLSNSIANQNNFLAKFQTVRISTGFIVVGAPAAVTVLWPAPYFNDNYTVELSLEDPSSGQLILGGFTKISEGLGILVTVSNGLSVLTSGDPNNVALAGILHCIAKQD